VKRYSLFALLSLVAVVAILLGAISWGLGAILLFGLPLMAAALLARFALARLVVATAIVSTALASLPWLGLGPGAFTIPVWDIRLPRASEPVGSPVYGALNFVYIAASSPLALTAAHNSDVADAIYFAGEGPRVVRPFYVFLFWSVIAIPLWTSLAINLCCSQHRRQELESPHHHSPQGPEKGRSTF
jgi:hypothetical protein